MKITSHKSQIRCIRKEDPNFMMSSGIMLTPRAGFELHLEIPKEYRMIINECLNNGWLKPVAYMTEKEYMLSGLLKDNK